MKSVLAVAGLAAAVAAQDMSICDKYTTALLKENTAANQKTLLTLVVNTAVIGNYTKPNVGIAVPGLLAPGTGKYDGVDLLPYFAGGLASTNRGGDSGAVVNFLDGGAAEPLMKSLPANSGDSRQYKLLTHLYSYFGYLLGCSEFSNTTGAYEGSTSMYKVHKFMALEQAEVGWFINNVGLSAASFGVTEDDVATVGGALNKAFGYRCSPAASIPESAPAALQAICIADDCPISPSATCDAYASVVEPSEVPSTGAPKGNSTGGAMPSSSVVPSTGDASSIFPAVSGAIVAVVGFAALML